MEPSPNSLSKIQGLCWREKLNYPCPQFSKSDWDECGEDGPQTWRRHVRRNRFERLCDFIFFSSEHTSQSSRSNEANCASFSDDRGSKRGLPLWRSSSNGNMRKTNVHVLLNLNSFIIYHYIFIYSLSFYVKVVVSWIEETRWVEVVVLRKCQ